MIALLLLALGSAAAADPAPRWVTVGPAVTETVYALGHGEAVVGVDASSHVPAAADALPEVGTYHQVSAEGVLALRPTAVLAMEGVGPPSVLHHLRSTGVEVVELPKAATLDGLRARVRALASRLADPAAGARLLGSLDSAIAGLEPLPRKPRVAFLYARGAGTLMLAGRGSAPAALVEAAGGVLASDWDDYRPVTPEALVALAPDVLLLGTAGLQSVGGVDGLLAVPGMALTPAGRTRRVHALDEAVLLDLGPRTAETVVALRALLADAVVAP